MTIFRRDLNIDLPEKQSAFLWGPRKTGKTTLVKQLFPESIVYDFLKTDVYVEFTKSPWLLRQQLAAMGTQPYEHPVILDEVQKVPQLLDEVHWLIENKGFRFLLCASSARKLKRGEANMLGGRAWRYKLLPLVSTELGDFDLLTLLNRGAVPSHYLSENYTKSLQAYVQDYLKEEVINEGLTRNIPAFSRFFDALGHSVGELTNYSNIARDCGIDSKTVKAYYQILVDTLLGRMLEPFKRRQNRQVITRSPKFYLFDVGVANYMSGRQILQEKGEAFGKAFEQFLFQEIVGYREYQGPQFDVNFWRTKSGLEVDFVLAGGEVAIEAKGSRRIAARDLRPLKAFMQEFRPREAIVVSTDPTERIVDGIRVLPWRTFLKKLWTGDIIS